MDFTSAVETATQTPRNKIGMYMIHLDRANDRKPLIQKLCDDLATQIQIIPAVDGKELVEKGHPTHHNLGNRHSNGMIGATASHVKCCKEALETGKEWAVIFEDDCVLTQPVEELNRFLVTMMHYRKLYNLKYDIILLGALGYNSCLLNPSGVSSVYEFHGCHALIINKKGMKEYINCYYDYLSKNYIQAPDGIYGELLRDGILIGFGPTEANRYITQKQEGMWSYISEHLK